jgi:hypothetical protein
MLFLLAMEPLHKLFWYAQNSGVGHLHNNCSNFRMSLYADAAAVFINPTMQDIMVTKHILQIFGEASRLITNLKKLNNIPLLVSI